ncbi:hypothetical protein P9847_26870 [Paenibacillus chibensis]|uniref:Core-binding (CB) domain-containing protein n=1 Tax=Paenibacillus chibensis TaxID=59846 RepID=A0ABU6Q185_9BACL|nr:hypothetical protein [Paenibacillus chibensis]
MKNEKNSYHKLRFAVRAITTNIGTERRPREKQHAVIVIRNPDSGLEKIHDFTAFIFEVWKTKSFNTMRKNAYNLALFLNFVMEKALIDNWAKLTFEHASLFLNALGDNTYSREGWKEEFTRKASTIRNIERTLSHFYKYLADKKLLLYVKESDFNYQRILKDDKEIFRLLSPFKNVMYPVEERMSNSIHDLKVEFLNTFMDVAISEVPLIALGIYFQLFGGLRAGEVVNVSKSSLQLVGPNGLYGVSITLTKQNFRKKSAIKNPSGGGYVKKPRQQAVFSYGGYLPLLYKRHMKNYGHLHNDALFVLENGQPMNGANYAYYFNKLKKRFLHELSKSEDISTQIYARYLESKKWSTHIGRGMFTNITADMVGSPNELQISRGDSSALSQLSYTINTERLQKKANALLAELHAKLILQQKKENI